MKLENLEVGMKIKNYKKLCELMDEPEKSGASKRAQISEWERYVSFERQGNAFIIKEIRDVPLMSSDGRKKYMQYVEPLLLHYLSEYYESEHTFRNWGVWLGLTSGQAYADDLMSRYQDPDCSGWNHSTIAIQRARTEIEFGISEALKRTVKALNKNGIISCKETMYVELKNNTTKEATSDEVAYIQYAKKRIMDSMGVGDYTLQMNPKKNTEFYERLNQLYLAEKDWKKSFTLLSVLVENEVVVEKYGTIQRDELIKAFQKELISAIQKKMFDEVQRHQARDLRKAEEHWGERLDKEFTMTTSLAHEIMELVKEII